MDCGAQFFLPIAPGSAPVFGRGLRFSGGAGGAGEAGAELSARVTSCRLRRDSAGGGRAREPPASEDPSHSRPGCLSGRGRRGGRWAWRRAGAPHAEGAPPTRCRERGPWSPHGPPRAQREVCCLGFSPGTPSWDQGAGAARAGTGSGSWGSWGKDEAAGGDGRRLLPAPRVRRGVPRMAQSSKPGLPGPRRGVCRVRGQEPCAVG